MSKRRSGDISKFFPVLASKSADGTDLTKDQKLQMRLEYHRPALEKEAADAKRHKVKILKRKEEEFELEGWRREWDSANSIEMASREVKRAENFRIVWADEARVSATTDPDSRILLGSEAAPPPPRPSASFIQPSASFLAFFNQRGLFW